MEKDTKYKVGDLVMISKTINHRGMQINIPPTVAKIIEVKESTPTYGIPYVLEINGIRCGFCFWEDDIDGKYEYKPETDEEFFWKTWGDK